MKRALCLILVLMVMLTGCGGSNTTTGKQETVVKDNRTNDATENTTDMATEVNVTNEVVDNRNKSDSNASVADSDFETKGYIYEDSIGTTHYFYIVKNNSDTAVEITGAATAYDSAGNVIGAADSTMDVLGAGEESIMTFYLDEVTGVDKVDCKLSYDTSPYYKPVIGNISTEQTINDSNVTIVATNNGDIEGEFVEAYGIFFDKDNNVVEYGSTYLIGGDETIKPGQQISGQIDSYTDFDHVECYLRGRYSGDVAEQASDLSDDDFSIKEYKHDDEYGSPMYFLAITNNSDKNVEINGNMTAFDANNNVIGAADGTIDILGPGEESVASFYFSSVGDIDHVSYQLSYNTDPYYEPVIKDLAVTENINAENVVVSVTNNGSKPAEFVEAHALFMDASDNVVEYTSGYLMDADDELKPGETLSEQLDSYKPFDHVVVYLDGRRSE